MSEKLELKVERLQVRLLDVGPEISADIVPIITANAVVITSIRRALAPVFANKSVGSKYDTHYAVTTTIATVLQHLATSGVIGIWRDGDKERHLFDPNIDMFVHQDAFDASKFSYGYFFRTPENGYQWNGCVEIKMEVSDG